tara:strand:- start:233 stop:493 length:261 start_codon:yes stop_codon:yes gene_type:complete
LHVLNAATSRRWRFRSQRTFFGLGEKYIENVYEQFFLLKYHGGWSFFEVYNLPTMVRQWFLIRLRKQLEKEKQQAEEAHQASKRKS